MNRQSFKAIFDKYYRPLCHFAYGITQDSDAAEDVVQDVFLHIWNHQITLEETGNVKSLLFTATRNKALEVLRKNAARDRLHENVRYLTPDHTLNVADEEMDKFLLIEHLYICIRQLPPKCGEVFTLSKVNGLSYTRISEKLGISVKTVENHMSKAFRLLKTMLSETNTKTE